MAITYKVIYKNHCTPQEQILSNGRYYLDSDCGRKLTGNCETSASLAGAGSYNANLVVADNTPSASLTSTSKFIFIKNTGGGSGNDVLITLDNSNYLILLSSGESFASEINTSAVVKANCASDEDSTIEYYAGR
mgnify:FL=1|jgi:hypothetical protein